MIYISLPVRSHAIIPTVPQYEGDPMPEVLRSKLFYARASVMVAIPTYRFLTSELTAVQMGIVNNLLASTSKAISSSLLHISADGLMNQVVIDAIVAKGRYASREYIGRAWTLAGAGTLISHLDI